MRVWVLATAVVWLGCGDRDPPYPEPRDPDAAPVVSIDRFSADFAQLFARPAPAFNTAVMAEVIPAPNEPIDMDGLFLAHGLGPAGAEVTYYALEVAPFEPAPAFVVVDASGEVVAEQLPVIEHIPGEDGYNDFVRIFEVHVGDDYPPNGFTSVAEIEAAQEQGVAAIVAADRIANWALVPAGTTATLQFEHRPVTGFRAWRSGEVVHFLGFDRDLRPTLDDKAPASNVMVIFANDEDPTDGFAVEADQVQTHNVLQTLPGQERYSSLWFHQKGKLAGFDAVHDWPSAVENYDALLPIAVNCPVVTP